MPTVASETVPLAIVLPTYNDWLALGLLLARLDAVLEANYLTANVMVVDDGSSIAPPSDCFATDYRAIRAIDRLMLIRNLGHQRAIAVGMAYINGSHAPALTIVMDADGEDDPADLPRLLAAVQNSGGAIAFAERTQRSESVLFRLFYLVYKAIHVVLTGKRVRVGNYSAIPAERLDSLVCVSELWNHYPSAAEKSRQPMVFVPTPRAKRLAGESKMNFTALAVHGLSAISVYSELVGVRLLIASCSLAVVAASFLVATVLIRLFTDWAIPGWATSAFGLLVVTLLQAILFCIVFTSIILSGRNQIGSMPAREHLVFVKRCTTVFRR